MMKAALVLNCQPACWQCFLILCPIYALKATVLFNIMGLTLRFCESLQFIRLFLAPVLSFKRTMVLLTSRGAIQTSLFSSACSSFVPFTACFDSLCTIPINNVSSVSTAWTVRILSSPSVLVPVAAVLLCLKVFAVVEVFLSFLLPLMRNDMENSLFAGRPSFYFLLQERSIQHHSTVMVKKRPRTKRS